MKLEDIKKMSDEEFIEYVKGLMNIEYYVFGKPENEKLLNRTKIKNIISKNFSGALFSALGATTFTLLAINSNYISETNEKLITIAVAGLLYGVGYSLEKIEIIKSEKEKQESIRHYILEIKKIFENLTEEELKILIENISFYKEYKVSDELIKRSDVLLAANRLIELNATNILEEFELSNDNNSRVNYSDDEKVIDSVKTIKNN